MTMWTRGAVILLTIALAASSLDAAGPGLREPSAAALPPPVRPLPAPATVPPPWQVALVEVLPADTGVTLNLPTQYAVFGTTTVVTDYMNDRFLYRTDAAGAWLESPIPVRGPHSVTFSPASGRFVADDTLNNRLIAFPSFASTSGLVQVGTIAGIVLDQPHDVVFDPVFGWTYALNPCGVDVFRLHDLGVDESVLELGAAAGYSRALTVVDGELFVVSSAYGEVVEVLDFSAGEFVVHPSFGKLLVATAGCWATTGLVLNDIERYQGLWYASSFFAPRYCPGSDYNQHKLIRFASWQDLAAGTWEDLSGLLPDAMVPYFLTADGGDLYLTAFYSDHVEDAVFRLTAGLLIDGFESGELGWWSDVMPR